MVPSIAGFKNPRKNIEIVQTHVYLLKKFARSFIKKSVSGRAIRDFARQKDEGRGLSRQRRGEPSRAF